LITILKAVIAASPEAPATDWYRTWLAATTPENLERQKIALQLIGQGKAFFRSEIIERLNALSLLNEVSPDKPTALERVYSQICSVSITWPR
jgi:hypothetical protein